MLHSGRRIEESECGTLTTPTGYTVRQVFPLYHPSQFWITASGIAFQKTITQGTYQWTNDGLPVALPRRMSTTWAVALAWTEPPDVDTQYPLRPVMALAHVPLNPTSIAWRKCSSHRKTDEPKTNTETTTSITTHHNEGNAAVQWTPLLTLPCRTSTCGDGRLQHIKLGSTEYHITQSGIIRNRSHLTIQPLRTHLTGRPLRIALPDGSAFLGDVLLEHKHDPRGRRNARLHEVYSRVVQDGTIDTCRIRSTIGSMGNDQTIHSAVFRCMQIRKPNEISLAFITATTSTGIRNACLDVMRVNPDATSAEIISHLNSVPTWQLYSEIRITRGLIRKFEFDPPDGWSSEQTTPSFSGDDASLASSIGAVHETPYSAPVACMMHAHPLQ